MEGAGAMRHPDRHAIEHFTVNDRQPVVTDRLLQQDEGAPQPPHPAVEGALAGHAWEERPPVLQGIAHKAPFGLPRHTAAPLGGQRQAQDFAVA